MVPFEVLGILIIIGSLLAYFLIDSIDNYTDNSKQTSIFTVVKNFNFSINLLITINGCILIGFNDATLDLHLKNIQNISPGLEGAIFVVQGAFYAAFNPYWGSLVDKVANKHSLCLAGCLFSMLSYIVAGPLPFLPIESNIWLVIVGQIFLGFAMGGLVVGSFTHGFNEIIKSGFAENVSTFAVISASFSSAFALGSAIGPALGGYLLGQLGYRWSTVYMVALEFLFVCYNYC
ncbi:MFS-type transporter SLC18B1-like [Oppia nitens]|uniref:MFS-type transporter SLC18B1-like n=1 Tax=Oppia nitens TaxID=1686743 RepID=UPI0023DB206D|nr:MFS-type transporter SLC18B1-like [Oppia nitens]